ncbi:MAG TPA: Hsp70 family protein [Verrucomicrobiae bacterium]|nr:Hsp70 family protein [Verrucomicrobiae bacterium]
MLRHWDEMMDDSKSHGVNRIVGIDLGTTNSLVATVDSGIPLVIPDAEGQRLTPSVVHFPAPSVDPVVGHAANRVRVLKPAETVYSAKRFIGRRGSEISQEEMLVTYPVKGAANGAVAMDIHGREYAPEEISAEVLKKLKRDAEAFIGEPVTRAVITVPAYFNDAQRNATKTAGELAGFTVERIVNEPTAAALAYGLDRLRERSKIAVYDLGGGTFDLSILELNDGVFHVLATNGNTRLGGDDLDKRIIDFLVEKIKAAGGPNLTDKSEIRNPKSEMLPMLSRIREAAEQAKIKLSTETEVEVPLPFLAPTFSFAYRLTRRELEDLTRDIIARTRVHCLRSLADAKLEPKDLDQVILVGGQTRMPLVRRFVAELFGCAETSAVEPSNRLSVESERAGSTVQRFNDATIKRPQLNTSQNPEEAVALGAAIQAEILSGGFKNMLLLDVTPLSLGIETFGGLMNVIIPRNSTIPVKAGEVFTTAVDNQRSVLIHVLQGERERARDNWSLGKFTLDFESAPKGTPRVGVQFEIDANGILHVLARDLKTAKQKVVEIKSAVDVDDAEVQKMVEESVEHAFEDLRARQWIETALSARQTIAAASKGLVECVGEIDTDYRTKVENALKAVENLLADGEAATQSGDAAKLKAALTALDEATQPLADLMMDKAMEAQLRKRRLVK